MGGLVGEDSHKLDKQSREDDDKGARPHEESVPCAIESAGADWVFHLENVRPAMKAEIRS